MVAGFMVSNKQYINAVQGAMNVVKEHVEGTLNDQWQRECGIRWTIVTEQTVNITGNFSSRRLYTVTWNHIAVSCVRAVHELNQRAPAVVVMAGQPMQPMQPQQFVQQQLYAQQPNNVNNVQMQNKYHVPVAQEEAQPMIPKQYSEGDNHVTNQ